MKKTMLAALCIALGMRGAEQPRQKTVAIPGTGVNIVMALIPEGEFAMGSPDDETGRAAHEPTPTSVRVDAFYMGIYEVTYNQFSPFQYRNFDSDSSATNPAYRVDAVSRPTPQYIDYTYGMGKDGHPAVSMTQQAALRYCQWLYEKTGVFFRLPTEAEWEYACRAGESAPYFFGNRAELLPNYAWYADNSDNKYHPVGTKQPNARGLYDMCGNVGEWTLDFYVADYAAQAKRDNPWIVPLRKHSRTVKGGGFDSTADQLRSAARLRSEPRWQARDPQIPKSKWWNPDSPFIGFRLVSPVEQPNARAVADFFKQAIVD